MNKQSVIPLLGCLFLAAALAGCAKPRTGPFDVPSAVPGHTTAQAGQGLGARTGAWSGGESSDSVNRAAAEIATAKVYFDFDRSAIKPEARMTIDRVAALLRQNPSIRISLHGYCDERGGDEYNYGLGERRARAVYGSLLGAGAPAGQLEMVNHGRKNPAASGRTEAAYSLNRRVEFFVLTTCY